MRTKWYLVRPLMYGVIGRLVHASIGALHLCEIGIVAQSETRNYSARVCLATYTQLLQTLFHHGLI